MIEGSKSYLANSSVSSNSRILESWLFIQSNVSPVIFGVFQMYQEEQKMKISESSRNLPTYN